MAWLVVCTTGCSIGALGTGRDAAVPDAVGAIEEAVDAGAVVQPDDAGSDARTDAEAPVPDARAPDDGDTEDPRPFTQDFRDWLAAHGYGADDFARDGLVGGAFGGRARASEARTHDPVVFVHGNSDRALGGALGGWTALRDHLWANGWRGGELFGITWGPADPAQASQQYHARAHLTRLRRFTEAVLAYTGAARIDVVSHSMGVTLARKVIAGGAETDALAGGAYDLGPSLASRVDAFVGIAGANLGLVACWQTGPVTPTCGTTHGFYPGTLAGTTVVGRSQFLDALNAVTQPPGAFAVSVWSPGDDVIGYGGIVWSRPTSEFPGQHLAVVIDAPSLGHLALKQDTAARVRQLLELHR